MKTLITIAALLVMAGCANIKKTTTTHTATVDSVTTTTHDTASKVTAVQKSKSLQISDVTFRIAFGNGDTVTKTLPVIDTKKTPKSTPQKFDDEIVRALADFNPDHSQIVSISGTIGSIRELDDITSSVDSHGVKSSATANVNRTTTNTVAVSSSWHWPLWLTLLSVAAVLIVILLIIKKFIVL